MFDTFTIAPGGTIESFSPRGFSDIAAIRVDNFSGAWLSIEHTQLWIPPYTRGYIAKFFPTVSSVTMKSYDAAYGKLITAALGGIVTVVLYSWAEMLSLGNSLQDSEGINFLTEQATIAVAFAAGNYPIIAAPIVIIPAPVAGRIRVWWITTFFTANQATYPYSIRSSIYGTGWKLDAIISPANPATTIVPVAPGGDLSIGSPITWYANPIDNGSLSAPDGIYDRIEMNIYYSII
jgi:hypothetical protein